ncbi:CAP domain-containing protein [Paraburkholderia phenazinium]|uniref:Uncharacterized conserved protein YkwD, contains CAP (CSP/antigen 5/PR1) domain n=1 Tax=Paraburkholderia phenazinium TaxID=60549 RepID=A0A1N6KYC0_9BURK|nr:CAP domain-containing protein [Paraburkholderia phenazinium]SIO61551.1 Uncharacterized conserved protein YkwD, contains CAP (CSP/antigen 5/PR1) domain [Paraburkholderia phenazinium]
MNKKRSESVLAVLAAGFSISLAACGGGGSSPASASVTASAPASASSPSVPSTPPSASLTTSATNPFVAGTGPSAIFAAVNSYRSALGVGQLTDDPILDSAALAHATYLEVNFANGNLTAFSHDEISTLPDFYAETPLARADKAGAPATEFVGEEVTASPLTNATAAGNDCVTGLLNSVYHLSGLVATETTLGIGFTPITSNISSMCVLDVGVTNASGTPQANDIPITAGQQMAATAVAHVPLANESGVALAMAAESPNPVPNITSPGRPLMVRVRADQAGAELTVSSFTLTSNSGAAVAGEILIPTGAQAGSTSAAVVDANGLLPPGTVFLVPQAPLAPSTTYTATFAGERDGSPVNVTWSFSTGSN